MVALSKSDEQVSPARSRTARARTSARASDTTRLCAVHRVDRPISDLIRFVADPDGRLIPDLKQNLPGRGVWVSSDKLSIAQATAQNIFARSLKKSVSVSPDLAADVETLFLKRVLATLSLANKAGAVVNGFTKTALTIEKGRLIILLHGSDGAADGCNKLTGKFLATGDRTAQARQIVAILTTSQLSLAIGRTNVVHAGITEKGIARTFLSEARRFERYGQSLAPGETIKSQNPIGNE